MRALLKNNKQNNNGFTHIDSDGSAHMVDVGDKKTTNRVAVASSEIIMEKETLDLIQNGGFEKGDVLYWWIRFEYFRKKNSICFL